MIVGRNKRSGLLTHEEEVALSASPLRPFLQSFQGLSASAYPKRMKKMATYALPV